MKKMCILKFFLLSAKLKGELKNCVARYKEVLVELEKKATIGNQCEEGPGEEKELVNMNVEEFQNFTKVWWKLVC